MRSVIWRHFDFWLFGAVVILCVFGIAMIRSAIGGNVNLAGIPNRQVIWVTIGLVVILGTTMIDYHLWAAMAKPMYIVMILLLVTVFVVGEAFFGSARWIETEYGFFIQPSELGKIVLIIVQAEYFSRTQNKPHNLRWVITSAALTIGMVIWILLQPNLSTSIVCFVIWLSMLWVSGLPIKYIPLFGAAGLVGGLAAFPFLEEYQQQRVFSFLIPQETTTHGNAYNVDQALISIGSGGWFGMGYGNGTQVQLRYLQVRHTDYIFSAMAEEFGFVGTVLVIGLLLFVILRCLRAARLSSDMFGSLIAFGFAILIAFQMAVNIGVNMNVIPVTGLTLPFISYGGSSLLSLVLGIGLVESVIMRHKPLEF
ncbi:MAG TPA: FtsW/RodA/SpoVE family cell cycle protein [Anaerolineaceae bacterium]|nr:FtsW/RodA/SpoVE family cell cycle protein [Anaerolineaceae bacterium]